MVMQSKVEAAKAGSLKISASETDVFEADKMLARAEEAKTKADRMRLEASGTSEDVLKFESQMREWDAKIGEIQNDFFSFVRGGELQDAKVQWAKLNTEKLALIKKAEKAKAEADKLAADAAADRTAALAKKASALKAAAAADEADQAKLLMAANSLVEDAEKAMKTGGKEAALALLSAGTDTISPKVFAALNLKPDVRASPGSLPGRLYAIYNPPAVTAAPAKKAASPSSAAAMEMPATDMDQETMTRGAFLAAALAALGGAAFYGSKQSK
jgi:hypothetical protein